MLEPENVLIDLAAVREEKTASKAGQPKRGRGRPRKTEDSVAEERNNDIKFLEEHGLDIRRNQMNGDIEYMHPKQGVTSIEGDDLTVFTHFCAHHFGITIPEVRMKNAVLFSAGLNSYCPVAQYLENCVQSAEPSPHFNEMATRYLNNSEPIANESLKRLMVGMVARIFKPASPLSFLPILEGAQGLGKSLYSRTLVPEEMFAEISANLETITREMYRLHRSWLIELGEIDRYFVPSRAEDFKNLITIRTDEVRLPYQLPTKKKRRFGMIGTTNQPTFLCDSTGNRRFIPIHIAGDIRIDLLEEERDSLWAAAVQCFKAGDRTEFTSGELVNLTSYQDDWLEVDTWALDVTNQLKEVAETTSTKILTDIVGIPLERQNTGHRRRVGAILRGMGWKQKNTTRAGVKVRLWVNPNPTLTRLDDF
jgi:predicted P-loop ATPase